MHPVLPGQRYACPTPPRTEPKNVEQPIAIVTHRRLEVNPKAYPAWTPDLCGHAVLCGPKRKAGDQFQTTTPNNVSNPITIRVTP